MSIMKIVALCNQKGGVGKTTSAVNLSVALGMLGKKVLLLDLDPQANSSVSFFGFDVFNASLSMYNVLVDEKVGVRDVIRRTEEGIDLLPSNLNLAGAELELTGSIAGETALKDKLAAVQNDYDYTFIDCPPALNIFTINALVAATDVFVCIQPSFLPMVGTEQLTRTIKIVKDRLNKQLRISGVILTMCDERKIISRESINEINRYFSDVVFEARIRIDVKLEEAPSYTKSIFKYAPDSRGAEDYMNLAKEVIRRV
ncbi:MAG: ParA family protein [Candidatus Atabeyarchaeum deiterrae]